LGYYQTLWVALSISGLLFSFALLGKKHFICLLLIAGMLGMCHMQAILHKKEPLQEQQGNVITITGRVLSVEDKQSSLRVIVKPMGWQCGDVSGNTRHKLIVNLSLPSDNKNGIGIDALDNRKPVLAGKVVRLKGRFTLPSGMRNPGLFDYRLFLRTKGIIGIVNTQYSHLEVIGHQESLSVFTQRLKDVFSSCLEKYMESDTKALFLGILFGDKSLIDEDIYEAFQRNGCAHILSVSGIHVSIIYIYISRLFRNRRSHAGSVCVLGLLLFYVALADFSASVVRAAVMIGIHILSKFLHRRYDLLCCISFSALLMLLYNPFYLFNLGFQLSYLAVFTLAFALPAAESKINKLKESRRFGWLITIAKAFAPVFAVQAGMAPATAYHFQYFSLSAFFINLPVIALAGLILPLGMGLLALVLVMGEPCTIFGFGSTMAGLLVDTMIKLNRLAGELSISSMNVTSPPVPALVIYYGFFFFLTSESFLILKKTGKRGGILVICLCILCCSFYAPFAMGKTAGRPDIVFLDVGQGDCIHIRTPEGKNILIDGGGGEYDTGKKILAPYLLKNGALSVDLAVVTHLHQDHYGGIVSLCNRMPVKKLAVYSANFVREENILAETGLDAGSLVYVDAGDRIRLGKDVYIDVLYPEQKNHEGCHQLIADRDDENYSCLVLWVYYRGVSLLVTGDMGFEGEMALMDLLGVSERTMLKADILKVGHHGSRFSSGQEFLDAVDPKIAVIQVGKNNFGHPHPDVIEKLTKKDIIVLRNDIDGAVLLKIRKDGISMSTML